MSPAMPTKRKGMFEITFNVFGIPVKQKETALIITKSIAH
jgi:hypothetical protein